MPFFDDTGPDLNEKRPPFWASFITLIEQLERWILLNMVWSLTSLPLFFAFMGTLPLMIRFILIGIGGVSLAMGTGVLYGIARAAVFDGEMVTIGLMRDMIGTMAIPAALTLIPLFGLFGLLGRLITATDIMPIAAVAQLLIILGVVFSMRWGVRFAADPTSSFLTILMASGRDFWQNPLKMVWQAGLIALIMLIGIVSIGGIILIIPTLITIMQTHYYQQANQ